MDAIYLTNALFRVQSIFYFSNEGFERQYVASNGLSVKFRLFAQGDMLGMWGWSGLALDCSRISIINGHDCRENILSERIVIALG